MLVQKYRDAKGDGDDKEIRATISHAIDASPSLRNKKDLIEDFVDSVSATGDIDEEWTAYVAKRVTEELDAIIERRKASSPRRLGRSSRPPSAMARSRPPAPPSRRCFRQSRASRLAVATVRRSSAC